MVKIDTKEILRESAQTIQNNLPTLGLVAAVYAGVPIIVEYIAATYLKIDTLRDPWYLLATIIISLLLYYFVTRAAIWSADGKNYRIAELFSSLKIGNFLTFFISSFLLGIAFGIGLLLLVVPGIYIILRYGFAPYFIVDKGYGYNQSFSASSDATEGVKMRILPLFLLMLIAAVALTFVHVILSSLVVVFFTVAYAHVYRRLLKNSS